MLLKLLGLILLSSMTSIFCWTLTLVVCKVVVDIFELNYTKNAYWVFNVAFYVSVISWILSFFFGAILMEK